MKWWKKRIGLALGGGGARGLTHIGVLKVFEQEGIPLHVIAGTSIGSLVGGAYASGMSPGELEKKFQAYTESPEFQSSAINAIASSYGKEAGGLTQKIQSFLKNQYYLIQMLFKPGILSVNDFRSMIDFFIPDIKIEDTHIPFRAVASDLISGDKIVFSEGSLRQAIMASCAVPGAIEPLKEGKRLLADGGIISLTPVSVAKEAGADIVIAVVVNRDLHLDEELKTAMDVYYRASEITTNKLEKYELKEADVIVRPDIKNLHWSNFSQAIDLIGEGEKATRENLAKIRSAMSVFNRLFKKARYI
jgi:NTE family protein